MAFEQREGQGSLFKNHKREPESNQPNATGKCMVGGVIYEVSAWTKKDKNGNPWQSLSFKVKGEQASQPKSDLPDESDPF